VSDALVGEVGLVAIAHPETSQIGGVRMFPKFRKVSIPLVGEVVGLGQVAGRWVGSGWVGQVSLVRLPSRR
jgi:hypothetical protein